MYRYKEKLFLWFVWKLPHSIVYWCTIRLMTTVNLNHPDEMKASEYLQAYGE